MSFGFDPKRMVLSALRQCVLKQRPRSLRLSDVFRYWIKGLSDPVDESCLVVAKIKARAAQDAVLQRMKEEATALLQEIEAQKAALKELPAGECLEAGLLTVPTEQVVCS